MPTFIWDAAASQYRNLQKVDYGKKIAEDAISLTFGLAKDRFDNEIVHPNAARNPASRVNWRYSEMTSGTDLGAPSAGSPQWTYIGATGNETEPTAIYTYAQPNDGTKSIDDTQGDMAMAEIELPLYYQAKAEARAIADAMGSSRITRTPTLWRNYYANCSGFTGAVIIRTVDPHFPGVLVENQIPYLNDAATQGVWKLIGYTRNDTDNTTNEYDPSKYKPGDIFITHRSEHTHTFLWIGAYRGFSDIVAEASNAARDNVTLRLPELRRIAQRIRQDGVDNSGRPYQIWRYMGGTYTPTLNALVPRTSITSILSNPAAVLRGPITSGQLDQDSIVDVSLTLSMPQGILVNQRVYLTTESPFVLSVPGNGEVRTAANALIARVSVPEDDTRTLAINFRSDGSNTPIRSATVQFTASFEDGYMGSADTQPFVLKNANDATDFSTPITYTIE